MQCVKSNDIRLTINIDWYMEIKQKWIKEGAVFYPIPGNTTFHASPGDGVFQVYESRSMSGTRLGLLKIADKFSFNFKIYDLGIDDTIRKIKTTWNSDIFVDGNKNLGVIFNGLKGTGKTIAAKILSKPERAADSAAPPAFLSTRSANRTYVHLPANRPKNKSPRWQC